MQQGMSRIMGKVFSTENTKKELSKNIDEDVEDNDQESKELKIALEQCLLSKGRTFNSEKILK